MAIPLTISIPPISLLLTMAGTLLLIPVHPALGYAWLLGWLGFGVWLTWMQRRLWIKGVRHWWRIARWKVGL